MTYYYSLTYHRTHRQHGNRPSASRCHLEFDPWARFYFCADPTRSAMFIAEDLEQPSPTK